MLRFSLRRYYYYFFFNTLEGVSRGKAVSFNTCEIHQYKILQFLSNMTRCIFGEKNNNKKNRDC